MFQDYSAIRADSKNEEQKAERQTIGMEKAFAEECWQDEPR